MYSKVNSPLVFPRGFILLRGLNHGIRSDGKCNMQWDVRDVFKILVGKILKTENIFRQNVKVEIGWNCLKRSLGLSCNTVRMSWSILCSTKYVDPCNSLTSAKLWRSIIYCCLRCMLSYTFISEFILFSSGIIPGCRSRGPSSIPGATTFSEK
jgi:hypothetical protein